MSLPSVESKGLFHVIAIIFIPGILVVIPVPLIIYLWPDEAVRNIDNVSILNFFDENHTLMYILCILLAFVIGLVLENIGSWIEEKMDECNDVNNSAFMHYLFSKCGDENFTILHKYVDGMVFRYKFELSLIPALFVFYIEWYLIKCIEFTNINPWLVVIISYLIVGVFIYIIFEAKKSCIHLNNIRLSKMRCDYKNKKIKLKNSCNKCKQCLDRCPTCGLNDTLPKIRKMQQ